MIWVWILIFSVLLAVGAACFLILTRHHRRFIVIPDTSPTSQSTESGGSVIPPIVSTTFGAPQLLRNPTDTDTGTFGEQVWSHDLGYLAISYGGGLHFYETNEKGALEYSQSVEASALLTDAEQKKFSDRNQIPVIVAGCFSPNVGTVPYFIVSVGHDFDGYRLGRVVLALAYDGDQWLHQPAIRFTPDLFDPLIGTTWTAQKAIGQLIRVVVDRTGELGDDRIHVYFNATNVVESQPGGSVLWFSMDRDTIFPSTTSLGSIQDFRLQAIWSINAVNITKPTTTVAFLRSFGANFVVDSSDLDETKAVLVISNPGVEDSTYTKGSGEAVSYASYPSKNGYTQVFKRDDNHSWESQTDQRYPGQDPGLVDGYGTHMVLYSPASVWVAARESPMIWNQITFGSTNPTVLQVPDLPVAAVGDSILTAHWTPLASQWLLTVAMPTEGKTCVGVFTWDGKTLTANQTLGLPTLAPSTASAAQKHCIAYAQTPAVWSGRRVIFAAINDPYLKQVAVFFKAPVLS